MICSTVYELVYISRNDIEQPNLNTVLAKSPVSFLLAIYCFVLLWLVGGLTLYHCSLILRGVTTHEQVTIIVFSSLFYSFFVFQIRADITRARYPELSVNPYSKNSPIKNMIQVLCQPQPKR